MIIDRGSNVIFMMKHFLSEFAIYNHSLARSKNSIFTMNNKISCMLFSFFDMIILSSQAAHPKLDKYKLMLNSFRILI